VSNRHSIQVSPDEERLHVHTRIFWLHKHSTFHTQCQLCNVFHWCMKFCRDHEDHVDIHQDRALSLPVILLTRDAVTRVQVAVAGFRVAVSRLQVAVTQLRVPAPDPRLSSPLAGVTILASSPLLSPLLPLFLFFFLGQLSLTHLLQSVFLCHDNTPWAPPWSWHFSWSSTFSFFLFLAP
jgi:hypothetical protein